MSECDWNPESWCGARSMCKFPPSLLEGKGTRASTGEDSAKKKKKNSAYMSHPGPGSSHAPLTLMRHSILIGLFYSRISARAAPQDCDKKSHVHKSPRAQPTRAHDKRPQWSRCVSDTTASGGKCLLLLLYAAAVTGKDL